MFSLNVLYEDVMVRGVDKSRTGCLFTDDQVFPGFQGWVGVVFIYVDWTHELTDVSIDSTKRRVLSVD